MKEPDPPERAARQAEEARDRADAERLRATLARVGERSDRAKAKARRAMAAADRARAAFDRVGDRDRIADERDRIADFRDKVADVREGRADRREGAADSREAAQDQRDLIGPDAPIEDVLHADAVALRRHAADIAESMAEQAEAFAAYLEEQAGKGDADRRLRTAEVEREIAAIERRNAARLRGDDWPVELERLPKLPVAEAPAD